MVYGNSSRETGAASGWLHPMGERILAATSSVISTRQLVGKPGSVRR